MPCTFCGGEHQLGFCPTGEDFVPTKIAFGEPLEAPPETPVEKKPKKQKPGPFDRTAYMRVYMRKRRKQAKSRQKLFQ